MYNTLVNIQMQAKCTFACSFCHIQPVSLGQLYSKPYFEVVRFANENQAGASQQHGTTVFASHLLQPTTATNNSNQQQQKAPVAETLLNWFQLPSDCERKSACSQDTKSCSQEL